MSTALYKKLLFAILILGASLRIGYTTFGDVLPVMWDQRQYVSAALGLISYVDRSGDVPYSDAREDRYRFKHYYEKYIQSEGIDYTGYTPHTLTQARDNVFVAGPLYPGILALIFLSPRADFALARLFSVLLDLVALFCLIRIGYRLVGRTASLMAGALYAIYFPYILTGNTLLMETPTTSLILATVLTLIRSSEKGGWRLFVLSGVMIGALILTKPTAMLLGIPLALGFYSYTRRTTTASLLIKRFAFMAVPAAAIFIVWLGIASAHFGQVTMRDPQYAEGNLRQSMSIEFEGYDMDKVSEEFWTRPIAAGITSDPVGFIGLLAKKVDRMWRQPYNDFRRSFIVSTAFNETFHKIILIVGFIGLLTLAVTRWSFAALPLLLVGYYAGIHLIFHSVARYNFSAIPMILLGTAFVVQQLFESWRHRRREHVLPLTLALSCLVIALALSPHIVVAITGREIGRVGATLLVVARTLLAFGGTYVMVRLLNASTTRYARIGISCTLATIIMVIGWSSLLARDQFAEFTCRLSEPQMKCGTRIYMRKIPDMKLGEQLVVAIDMLSGNGRRNTFTSYVADTSMELIGGQPPLSKLFYPKPAYRHFVRIEGEGIETFRQYAFLPVELDRVAAQFTSTGYLQIEIAINRRFDESNNYIELFGHQKTENRMPFLPSVRATSLERYVEKNDPRLRERVNLLSDSAVSYYIPRRSSEIVVGTDLSPATGIQTGRYNMFLMHFRPDGSIDVY